MTQITAHFFSSIACIFAIASVNADTFIVRCPEEAENSHGLVRVWPWSVESNAAEVNVATSSGEAVKSWIVDSAARSPLDILFECPDPTADYVVEVTQAGKNGAPFFPSDLPCGLFLETRKFPADLTAVDTFDQARAAWDQGTKRFGRSLSDCIFTGIHPHGSNEALLARFSGMISIGKPGRYGFAVLTDDASFLQVDGQPVAEWPGWHGNDGSGIHGEHCGFIELAEGPHRLELLNCQNDGGFNVVAAWQPPDAKNFAIIPTEAFPGPARYEVADAAGAGAEAAFAWEMQEHAIAQGHSLVGVRFRALWNGDGSEGAKYHWRFEDGGIAEGREVTHVFSSLGKQQVRLEVAAGREIANTRLIDVHPNWTQRHEGPDDVYARLRDSIRQSGMAMLSPHALSRLVELALVTGDDQWMCEIAPICHGRIAEFPLAEANVLFQLGLFVQKPCMRDYAMVPDFWHAILAMDPAPDAALLALVRLHFASFTIHSGGSLDEAERLLASIADSELSESDARLKLIFNADIRAMRGDREAAKVLYRQAGGVVDADDTAYQVRRLARLENARVYLRNRDFDAAEKVAREIEWERPLERMGLETGLVFIAALRGRGEMPFAIACCRRLLVAVPDDPRRPELLFAAANLFGEQGLPDDAKKCLDELFRDYPYSEQAALAR